MKFHFANIGPIRQAELELGDLTIIAGRNNTGKTYVVYTLYGFLMGWRDTLIERNYFRFEAEGPVEKNLPGSVIDIEEVGIKLMEDEQYQCQVSSQELHRERQVLASWVAKDFSSGQIHTIFSSSPDNFKNATLEVIFNTDFPANPGTLNIEHGRDTVISIRYDHGNLIFSTNQVGKIHPRQALALIASAYMLFLLGNLESLPAPFILSAERFGISLFYKELDFTKNRLVEFLQNMENEKVKEPFPLAMFMDKNASRYALPIKHNIDYTRNIADSVNEKSALEDKKLHDDVKNIMDGYYKSDKDSIRFVSKARKNARFDIPLHLASSSARGLSDLYFYLRHKAEPNQLLIIDEPESHLDTKNQINLARILSHFIHAGIKVLITTHSDYVLKEINNLVMLSNSFPGKKQFVSKHKYKENEFLRPEELRCYVAQQGQLTSCSIDKFGVDMPVFDETIDEINKISNELANRLTHAENE